MSQSGGGGGAGNNWGSGYDQVRLNQDTCRS